MDRLSLMDCLDEYGKNGYKEYYKQFHTLPPVIGKVYVDKQCGIVSHIEIVAIVENCAIGKIIWSDNCYTNKEGLKFYHADGNRTGWKYGDQRPNYRLVLELDKT